MIIIILFLYFYIIINRNYLLCTQGISSYFEVWTLFSGALISVSPLLAPCNYPTLNDKRYLNRRRRRGGKKKRYFGETMGAERLGSLWASYRQKSKLFDTARIQLGIRRGFIYRRINLDSCNISQRLLFFSLSLSLSPLPNILVDCVIRRRPGDFPRVRASFFSAKR